MTPLPITRFEPGGTVGDADGGAAFARQRRALRERHWSMLAICSATIVASFALSLNPEGRVAAPSAITLPVMCGSRALFGVECPGCGLTRSFVALAHGDVRRSLSFHRVGWIMAAAVAGQLLYRPWMLYELRSKLPTREWPTWFGSALIALLIGNWLLETVGI